MEASLTIADSQADGTSMVCQCEQLSCKQWCPPKGACQDPGLLWDISHSALDPHVATVLLHLAQKCCQHGALTCTSPPQVK